jgi:hypothetical protein
MLHISDMSLQQHMEQFDLQANITEVVNLLSSNGIGKGMFALKRWMGCCFPMPAVYAGNPC